MKAKKTTNLASISSTNIGELPIIYPPKKQRDMILAYVKNYEDLSSLLIKKILSSIERLVEYRSALISAAVTGKIDVRQEAKV
jgi:restriction endonuclease S subunit